MPPVLGPRSPSSSRLWSCAGRNGSQPSPSVRKSNETSSPSMCSSTRISAPAAPNTRWVSMASIAASASASVPATVTPLPAASPEALITTGAPSSRAARRASSARVCRSARAVGTPALRISSLANTFELSTAAAAAVGPKIGSRRARNRSTMPRASGASGPTIVRSGRSDSASARSPSMSVAATGRHRASVPIPGFPGAATRSTPGSSSRSFQARACSRPPPPTMSTFTGRPLPGRTAWRRSGRRPARRPVLAAPAPAPAPRPPAERLPEGVPRVVDDRPELAHGGSGAGAVMRGGRGVVVGERAVLRIPPPRILPAQDPRVVIARAPPLQLGRAHRVEGMVAEDGVEELERRIPGPAGRLVLGCLRQELIQVDRVRAGRTARELEVRAERGAEVLRAEQASAVAGKLGVAVPLEQGDLDREERDPRQKWQVAEPEVDEDDGDRAVRDVAAHHVPQLVGEHVALLLAVQQPQGRRVHDDEGVVESDRAGIDERRLGHVELWALRPVERRQDLAVQGVELGPLSRADPHRVRQEEVPKPTLTEESGDLAHDLVEARNSPQGVERGTVGGVLPCERRDAGERGRGHWSRCPGLGGRRERGSTPRAVPGLYGPRPRKVTAGTPEAARVGYSPSQACSRSSRRSSTSSTPQERRITPSVIPSVARRSSGIDAWVIDAGWLMRLSTPPRDSARAKTRTRPSTCAARARVPRSTVTIPPNPDIWRTARACCGWEGSPG